MKFALPLTLALESIETTDGVGVGAVDVANDRRFHTAAAIRALMRGYTFRALPSKILCLSVGVNVVTWSM